MMHGHRSSAVTAAVIDMKSYDREATEIAHIAVANSSALAGRDSLVERFEVP
jgi:hypothetical protein